MASKYLKPIGGALEPGLVILAGTVDLDSSAAVLTTGTFRGGTFTKPSGTGLYRLTLSDLYPKILCVQITPLAATYADRCVTLIAITNSTGVIDFTVGASGSAADPNAAMSFHVLVIAKNSGA